MGALLFTPLAPPHIMKLIKEDYEAFEESQIAHLKVQKMGVEATEVVLEWLKKKLKK